MCFQHCASSIVKSTHTLSGAAFAAAPLRRSAASRRLEPLRRSVSAALPLVAASALSFNAVRMVKEVCKRRLAVSAFAPSAPVGGGRHSSDPDERDSDHPGTAEGDDELKATMIVVNRIVPPRSSSGAAGCPAFLAQDASGLLQRESKGVVAAPAPRKTLLTLMTLVMQVARAPAQRNRCHELPPRQLMTLVHYLRHKTVACARRANSPRPLLPSQRQPSEVPWAESRYNENKAKQPSQTKCRALQMCTALPLRV